MLLPLLVLVLVLLLLLPLLVPLLVLLLLLLLPTASRAREWLLPPPEGKAAEHSRGRRRLPR